MSHLAEFERDLLSERTREGLVAARGRGHNGGRPPHITQDQRRELLRTVDAGRNAREAGEILNISRTHAYRIVAEERAAA